MTNINNLIETINKKKAEEKPDTKSMPEANANEGSQEASPEQKLTVGVMGIGHIGGSFAKAYHHLGHKVLACDTDRSMLQFAKISGDVDEELTRDNMSSCDLILLCAYPQAVIDFLNTEGPFIGPNPIVIDCCGTKRVLVDAGMDAAKRFGFTYVGGHPMAGTQYSGFKHSRKDLFFGAPMVVVPPTFDDIELLMRVKRFLEPIGFKQISVTTADAHDEMIAFTSQLAHVVSSAYIKSPTAGSHKGFSAGSYKDMTRVAWLNPPMWAELFIDNKEYLLNEIDTLLENISKYRTAIAEEDADTLEKLLEEGRNRKAEIDG